MVILFYSVDSSHLQRRECQNSRRSRTTTEVPPLGLVLLGPPGSGKGTLGGKLAAELCIPRISTGDLLRAETAAETRLGKQVQGVIGAGGLVDDGLANGLVERRVRHSDCCAGFVLDGYPRTLEQARFLDGVLAGLRIKEPIVMNLEIEIERLVHRLAVRRHCPVCGRTYSDLAQPSRIAGRCDNDRSLLIQRPDDHETVVRARVENFQRYSSPLLDYYRDRNIHAIDASASTATVLGQALRIVEAERQFRISQAEAHE